jgi:signal transduction histidine kinase/CheY-like chemotaxis protein
VLETATSHRAEVCTNFESSAMFQRAGLTLSEAGLVSYLSLPLKAHGQLAGVVEIYADRIVEETEARLLEIVVGQCAALIALSYNLIETRRSQENLELKNLELAMANRKLERSNNSLSQADRVKGEFLANTSHELRTPLNSILGFAQLITGGSCESDEEVRQYANAIRESGERLLKMINEVLDLAKIEAGKMNVQLGPVDVRTLFDAVKSLMGVQAGQQGNKIRAAIPDVPLPLLRADHTKLYQVLVNLVGNANKFTREGEIVLSVVPESAPGFMRIEIADTGEGIEPEQLPQLFQSFVQGDGSTTRKFGGTGLGLTISKKLIELIGGAIDLSSEGRGKGATVTLEVPLWSDELELQGATAVELAAENEPDPEARTIVIIEDYLEFQRYLAELVEAQGWRVLSARTAARGLDLIRRHKPSAIVLDMHLPSDDEDASIQTGYDILSTLAKDVEMESTPTLVVTAMHREACDALLGQTLLLPVELYSKPLDEEAFLKSLERLTAAV